MSDTTTTPDTTTPVDTTPPATPVDAPIEPAPVDPTPVIEDAVVEEVISELVATAPDNGVMLHAEPDSFEVVALATDQTADHDAAHQLALSQKFIFGNSNPA